MPIATAADTATLNIPAIYRPSADADDYINREVEKWFAQHGICRLSDCRPENRILSPSLLAPGQSMDARNVDATEWLEWDVSLEVAPIRPAGTLSVVLEYAGRGTPSPTSDPWD